VDGGKCPRTSEGGPSTEAEEEKRGDSLVDQSGEEVKAMTGYIAPNLEAFSWLVDFMQDTHMTGQIWYNKLCYYIVNGDLAGRRLLKKDEVPKFEE